jgi:hypothetical protein
MYARQFYVDAEPAVQAAKPPVPAAEPAAHKAEHHWKCPVCCAEINAYHNLVRDLEFERAVASHARIILHELIMLD